MDQLGVALERELRQLVVLLAVEVIQFREGLEDHAVGLAAPEEFLLRELVTASVANTNGDVVVAGLASDSTPEEQLLEGGILTLRVQQLLQGQLKLESTVIIGEADMICLNLPFFHVEADAVVVEDGERRLKVGNVHDDLKR